MGNLRGVFFECIGNAGYRYFVETGSVWRNVKMCGRRTEQKEREQAGWNIKWKIVII